MNKEEQLLLGFREMYNKMLFLNKNKMEDALKGYKSSEVHCIEFIEKNAEANVTKLAESFYMTRGAISKMTKKLMERGIIESYQKPDNKKEIHFRLTERGREVYQVHETLHKEFQERDKVIFEQVSSAQFDSMINFVQKYCKHLDSEIRKQQLLSTHRDDLE